MQDTDGQVSEVGCGSSGGAFTRDYGCSLDCKLMKPLEVATLGQPEASSGHWVDDCCGPSVYIL